jgi:aconitate hydratase
MGVLPLQFKEGESAATLGIDGSETFDLLGLEGSEIRPMQDVTLRINRQDGETLETSMTLRIDTPIEIEYYKGGGILQYVLRHLLAARTAGVD